MKEVFQNNVVVLKLPLFHKKQKVEGVNTRQLIVGLSVLIFGVLFYYFFRSAEHTYFLKYLGSNHYLKGFLPSLFVTVGNSLPTFIHVLAFTLMTASLITSQKRGYAVVCFSWFMIEVLFELGQGLDNIMIQIIPDWFSNIIFLENTKSYFLQGRFDCLDIISITLGSIVAYIILIQTSVDKGETS